MRLSDQLVLLEEFERSAYDKRRKAMQVEQGDEIRIQDHRKKVEREEEKENQLFEEAMLATSGQLAAFGEKLDRYDTAVVTALMENRQALDDAEDALVDIQRHATKLPDGRRVYRSENSLNVFDEAGSRVGRETIDPGAIDAGAPTWESLQHTASRVQSLTAERQDLLAFQTRVDEAREQARRNGMTQGELQALGDDLERAMPTALRHAPEHASQDKALVGLMSDKPIDPHSFRPIARSDALSQQLSPTPN